MTVKERAWKGIRNRSIEKCKITLDTSCNMLTGKIIGIAERRIYEVNYKIITDTDWNTKQFEIITSFTESATIAGNKSETGTWTINGIGREDLKECKDIDISLTPATNTLSIKRLKLKIRNQSTIKVIYVNVLESEIKCAIQKYTRLSKSTYKYENVPNDFEANLLIDQYGLVINYSGLFEEISNIDLL